MSGYRREMFATAVWESPAAAAMARRDAPLLTASRMSVSRRDVQSRVFAPAAAMAARSGPNGPTEVCVLLADRPEDLAGPFGAGLASRFTGVAASAEVGRVGLVVVAGGAVGVRHAASVNNVAGTVKDVSR